MWPEHVCPGRRDTIIVSTMERILSIAEQVLHSSRERVTDLQDVSISGQYLRNRLYKSKSDAQSYPAQFAFAVSGVITARVNALLHLRSFTVSLKLSVTVVIRRVTA